MQIELVIDELVLHGFDPRLRHAIADAVEHELMLLLQSNPALLDGQQPMDIARVDAGAFETPAQAPSAQTGVGIANAVVNTLQAGAQ
jgi:hypothetical protein